MAGWHPSLLPLTLFLKIERSFTWLLWKTKLDILKCCLLQWEICLYWHWCCKLLTLNKLISLDLNVWCSGVWIKDAKSNWNVNGDTFWLQNQHPKVRLLLNRILNTKLSQRQLGDSCMMHDRWQVSYVKVSCITVNAWDCGVLWRVIKVGMMRETGRCIKRKQTL